MEQVLKNFGDFIKKIRIEKNISAYSIEKEYGISSSQWSRIENGKQNGLPKHDLMLKISEILDTSIIELYIAAGYITKKEVFSFVNQENCFITQEFFQNNILAPFYTKSNKSFRLTIHLPNKTNEEFSCLFEFSPLILSGFLITYLESDIKDIIFTGIKETQDYTKRGFVFFQDKKTKEYWIKLPNVSFTLNKNQLIDFCEIIDSFYDVYQEFINQSMP